SLLIGTPFFIFFGRLSDRIGRLKIILVGCLLAAATYLPLFKGLTHFVNPALEEFQDRTAISVAAEDCSTHIFVLPGTVFTPCDKAKDFLTKAGLSFETVPAVSGEDVVIHLGNVELRGWDEAKAKAALKDAGYPATASTSQMNFPMALLILVIL